MLLIESFSIDSSATILDALKQVDANGYGIVFVTEKDLLIGSLTDGDIRRAIISGASKSDLIRNFCNTNPVTAFTSTSPQGVMELFSHGVKLIPIIDETGRIFDIATPSRPSNLVVMEPTLGGREIEYVLDCLNTNWISSQGSYVSNFESRLSDVIQAEHTLAVSNGTVALHLALLSLGIGAGDEVITTNLTFGATVNAIIQAGATPVLVDIDEETWNIDPNLIEAVITKKTKAIVPVHIYGNPCEMDKIMDIASTFGLLVLEDCAEALGASYNGRKVGGIGDAAIVSFFANKVVTTGEGGSLHVRSQEVFERAKVLRDHGMRPGKRYWHDAVGYNYRMTNIQAAIGCAQLEQLEMFEKKRTHIFSAYDERFSEHNFLGTQRVNPGSKSANWLYTLILKGDFSQKRDELMHHLKANGVDTRPIFYPMNEMPAFRPFISRKTYPVSKQISYSGLSLPTSINLSAAECDYIADVILKYIGK